MKLGRSLEVLDAVADTVGLSFHTIYIIGMKNFKTGFNFQISISSIDINNPLRF
jgi:hypothetical protein